MYLPPVRPAVDAMATTRPHPRATMSGTNSRAPRNTLRAFTFIMRSQSAVVIARSGAEAAIPALRTRISTPPIRVRASSPICRTALSSAASQTAASARPPSRRMSAATCSVSEDERATTRIRAPAPARERATAAPMPRPPPVTTARRPSRGALPTPSLRGKPFPDRLRENLAQGLDRPPALLGRRLGGPSEIRARSARFLERARSAPDGPRKRRFHRREPGADLVPHQIWPHREDDGAFEPARVTGAALKLFGQPERPRLPRQIRTDHGKESLGRRGLRGRRQRRQMGGVQVRVRDAERQKAPPRKRARQIQDQALHGLRVDRDRSRKRRPERGRRVRERGEQHRSEARRLQFRRRRLGHGVGDQHVGPQRQVRTVGLDRAYRKERDGARSLEAANLLPGQLGPLARRQLPSPWPWSPALPPASRASMMGPVTKLTMTYEPPERLNIADHFLDARVREGRGERPALLVDGGTLTYRDVQTLANRFGNVLLEAGVEPEQRVLIALPDGPEFVAALFGTLKIGAVVVMVNPGLPAEEIRGLAAYTRARVVVAHQDSAAAFEEAARGSLFVKRVLVAGAAALDAALARASPSLDTYPSHRDDSAIWLFSGGTTGRPKAVVQTHRAFAYTAACYGSGVIGYTEQDVTLSVPKLYFGYATGSNLFFPFSAAAAVALYPEAATADVVFARIRQFRPTVLVNVPAMVHKLTAHAEAARQDLSSLRVVTSAGEALPVELYERW